MLFIVDIKAITNS